MWSELLLCKFVFLFNIYLYWAHFSHAYCKRICLLWRNVYLDPFPHFNISFIAFFLLSWLIYFIQLAYYQTYGLWTIFSYSLCYLFSVLMVSFAVQKFLIWCNPICPLFLWSAGVWTQGLPLEPLHQPIFVMEFLESGSWELFARVGFKLLSSWSLPARITRVNH
jgi:hypothetical protein